MTTPQENIKVNPIAILRKLALDEVDRHNAQFFGRLEGSYRWGEKSRVQHNEEYYEYLKELREYASQFGVKNYSRFLFKYYKLKEDEKWINSDYIEYFKKTTHNPHLLFVPVSYRQYISYLKLEDKTKSCTDLKKIEQQVIDLIKAYNPDVDESEPLKDISDKLKNARIKFKRDLQEILPGEFLTVQKIGATTQNKPDNVFCSSPGIRVKFVYADNPDEDIKHGYVYYWQYDKSGERLSWQQGKQDQRNGLMSPMGVVFTNRSGFVDQFLPLPKEDVATYPQSAYLRKDNGEKDCLIQLAPKGMAQPFEYHPGLEIESSQKKQSDDKEGLLDTDYNMDGYTNSEIRKALENELATEKESLTFSQKRSQHYFDPDADYGFFVYPIDIGHFKCDDVKKLTEFKDNNDKTINIAWKGKLSKLKLEKDEDGYPFYVIPLHCPLPEWDRRISQNIELYKIAFDFKSDFVDFHKSNLSNMGLLYRMTEYSIKYPFSTQEKNSKNTKTQLLNLTQDFYHAYQGNIELDIGAWNNYEKRECKSILDILKNPAFAEEFTRYFDSTKDFPLSDYNGVNIPASGPYMDVETGWWHIYHTVANCIRIFGIAPLHEDKDKELIGEIEEFIRAYLAGLTVASSSDLQEYIPENIGEILHNLTESEKSGVYSYMDLMSNMKSNHKDYPSIKSELESDIASKFRHFSSMSTHTFSIIELTKNTQSIYSILNSMPGPPSVLESIIHFTSSFVNKYQLSRAAYYHWISASIIRTATLLFFVNSGKFSEEVKIHFTRIFAITNAKSKAVIQSRKELERFYMSKFEALNGKYYRTFVSTINFSLAIFAVYQSRVEYQKIEDPLEAQIYILERMIVSNIGAVYATSNMIRHIFEHYADKDKNKLIKLLTLDLKNASSILGWILAVVGSVVSASFFIYYNSKGYEKNAEQHGYAFLATFGIAFGSFLKNKAALTATGTFVSRAIAIPAWILGPAAFIGSFFLAVGIIFSIWMIIDAGMQAAFERRQFIKNLMIDIRNGLEKSMEQLMSDRKNLPHVARTFQVSPEFSDLMFSKLEDIKTLLEQKDNFAMGSYSWRAVIPLKRSGLYPELIDRLVKIHEYSFKNHDPNNSKKPVLDAQYETLDEDPDFVPISMDIGAIVRYYNTLLATPGEKFKSGKTYSQVASLLEWGEFVPDRIHPEDLPISVSQVASSTTWNNDYFRIPEQYRGIGIASAGCFTSEYIEDEDDIWDDV